MLRFAVGVALSVAAFAQTQELRLTAGEARSMPREFGGSRIASIISSRTDPPLEFPPLVTLDENGAIRVTPPPATPRGQYQIHIAARSEDGREISSDLALSVDAVTIAPSASGKPPVVLMNGFQLSCPANPDSTLASAAGTFGQLASLLQADGLSVVFFNNCVYGAGASIESLAAQLGIYLSSLVYTDGSPVTRVDLVAHSMGGLIARAYLAGLQSDGSLNPPPVPGIRKLIQLAAPNFGSYQASLLSSTQTVEMTPGSAFLWNLATWNQRGDDLRGVDALAVIGNGGTETQAHQSDGLVSLSSGSLGFARVDQRTRIVPYCHVTASGLIAQILNCTGQGIADVDSPAHLSARILRSFLADTPDWQSIGSTPSADPFLSQSGGIYFAVADPSILGLLVADLTEASFGNVELTKGGAGGTVFYNEFLKGTAALQATSASLGSLGCPSFSEPPGFYSAFRCKSSPVISAVGPLLQNTEARLVMAGSTITIQGTGFGTQCAGCYVEMIKGMPELGVFIAFPNCRTPLLPTLPRLPVLTWSDQSISVMSPTFSGPAMLFIRTSSGSDWIGIVANAPGTPWLPTRKPILRRPRVGTCPPPQR
ncbi:MAG TPA: hypothetical protein VH639_11310 [Bryobacteraceae bacterium]|jgi:pimeloyl-ACP methyl ester carboxylesterase